MQLSDILSTITAFEIEPLKNIKGELSDATQLYQTGGYKNGVLYVEDEAPLMHVGETYLLAGTSVNGQLVVTSLSANWYGIFKTWTGLVPWLPVH